MAITLRRHLLAALALLIPSAAPAASVFIGDRQAYSCGSWLAFNSPWSTYSGLGLLLTRGKDYVDSTLLDSVSCPAEATISWQWPLTKPLNAGVYGYDFMSFGSYDGGQPAAPVAPKQVGSLRSLSFSYALGYFNLIGEYNILSELFLRTNPNDSASKALEIGFLLHVPPTTVLWILADKQLGTWTDASGRSWQVVQHPGPTGTFPYVTFSPPTGADVSAATLDYLGGIRFLQGKGLIQSSWWFSGLALGIEPISGSGWMRIGNPSVSYS